jgi:hypothetical protein
MAARWSVTTRSITLPDVLVRAAIAGRVSEIRVPIRPQPDEDGLARWIDPPEPFWRDTSDRKYRCSLGVAGDRLVAREAFNWSAKKHLQDGEFAKLCPERTGYTCPYAVYRADGVTHHPEHPEWLEALWLPSTQMPLWASRLAFANLGSRVERLLNITEEGAIACGADPFFERYAGISRDQRLTTGELCADAEHRASFAVMWDERFGDVAPWKANPWTWCAKVVVA